jgi:hypothetical protein
VSITPETTGEHAGTEPTSVRVKVVVYNRPWSPSTFTADNYDDLLGRCARETAERIAARARQGRNGYPRNSFAAILMDPTVGLDVAAEDALLAVISIGDEGDDFVPNAVAKAFDGRRLFLSSGGDGNVGTAVHTASHLIPDGGFRYGHGSKDFGGSGLSESMDWREAARLYHNLIAGVDAAREEWEEAAGPGRWFSNDDSPGTEYELPSWGLSRTFEA